MLSLNLIACQEKGPVQGPLRVRLLVNQSRSQQVYLNEIQSPWFLSHHSPSMPPVSSAPPSKPLVKPRSLRALPDAVHRSATRGDIHSQPLYLQNVFGANVRLVRFARGLSQEDLAELASLDRTYISAFPCTQCTLFPIRAHRKEPVGRLKMRPDRRRRPHDPTPTRRSCRMRGAAISPTPTSVASWTPPTAARSPARSAH